VNKFEASTFWDEERGVSELRWRGLVLTGTNEATCLLMMHLNAVEAMADEVKRLAEEHSNDAWAHENALVRAFRYLDRPTPPRRTNMDSWRKHLERARRSRLDVPSPTTRDAIRDALAALDEVEGDSVRFARALVDSCMGDDGWRCFHCHSDGEPHMHDCIVKDARAALASPTQPAPAGETCGKSGCDHDFATHHGPDLECAADGCDCTRWMP
jgi:hypothetical protein